MAKTPTAKQLAALAAGRRKQAAQAGDAAPAAPRAKRSGSNAWGWAAAIILVAALVWLLFASLLRPKALAPGGDLVRWTPGPPWRFREGQYIDPAAAAALLEVGDALGNDEACQPMTLDVSRDGGGPFPPHKSHQTGRDIDIRMSDLGTECRAKLQVVLASRGWLTWYDGPDNMPTPGVTYEVGSVTQSDGQYRGRQRSDGKHISHLHARFAG